ncbi:MAG: hypothetical protein ACLP1E_15290, partial [Acidimicrobiales bacterium]
GLRGERLGWGGASGMGLTIPAAPRYPANTLSRRPSQPPAYPKRAAWAVVADLLASWRERGWRIPPCGAS